MADDVEDDGGTLPSPNQSLITLFQDRRIVVGMNLEHNYKRTVPPNQVLAHPVNSKQSMQYCHTIDGWNLGRLTVLVD